MQIPILTYHSMQVDSNGYAGNDHHALAEDLRAIQSLGRRVVPLERAVAWHQGRLADAEVEGAIAITFDDGSWFDWYDLAHPSQGQQRSMYHILADFRAEAGADRQPGLHASCFVITSPAARRELDDKAMIGRGWWGDEWWGEAQASGLLGIECHSWDHNHPLLDRVGQRGQRKGDFAHIDSFDDCEIQLAKAAYYIAGKTGVRPRFFAFPWGQASDYLVGEYLPRFQDRHGFMAAFSTEPKPLERSDNRWNLPRYVCGRDWSTPEDFAALLGSG